MADLSNGRPIEYDSGGLLHLTHRHYALNATGRAELVYSPDDVSESPVNSDEEDGD
jgi:hypothetical protein